jgi:hypothetical protein
MNFETGDILVWTKDVVFVVIQVDRQEEECKFKYFKSEDDAKAWRDAAAI